MATFSVRFLGCKVSHVDAHELRERLLADGHRERGGDADVAVVNTCCVTQEAVAKSRKEAARAARTHRRVYVTGCAANLAVNAFAGLPGNVVVVNRRSEAAARFVADDVGTLGCVQADARFDRVRAFVKVQDGCSFSCNFCVIPLVRGTSRSRPAAAVLREVERRVAQGHREVVLTGINLGCFRDRAEGYDLAGLVREVGQTSGLERVRLSSIEINHVGQRLVAALRDTPTVSRHLHVPLQSGDDGVLAAMRRRYTATAFQRAMGRARERVPGVNLTTDVIVGHPAEDDAAFERTLAAVRAAGFTRVHVFPYSPRPGTADEASDPVPAAVKAERSRRLRELGERQARAHRRALRGTPQLVLVETEAGRGYADDYTPLVVPGGRPGTMVEVVA